MEQPTLSVSDLLGAAFETPLPDPQPLTLETTPQCWVGIHDVPVPAFNEMKRAQSIEEFFEFLKLYRRTENNRIYAAAKRARSKLNNGDVITERERLALLELKVRALSKKLNRNKEN